MLYPTELRKRKIYNYLILLYSIVNSFLKYCPFFAQCKVTRNIITWAHCMFSADQVAQLLDIPDISSTSNYVLVTTALIAAKVVPLASSTSQSKRRGFLRPLCIRSTTAGLKEHTQFTINCGPCQGEKFGSP